MIKVKNLTKKYGDHLAVDNVSFTVEQGRIYGFLGPNGAGKSTTMNMITGYLAATSGQVTINGYDIFEEPEKAKACIGYLPEQPPVYMDLTPKEYLHFVAELKKLDKSQRKSLIEKAMEQTGIVDVQNRLIKNLSKGYRQRVGLAQAILGYPPVIILDEPTVGLDPQQIIEIRELIRSLGQQHTVILSSHILQEVSAVCDHILIISQGKLVASDTPENLRRQAGGKTVLEMKIKAEDKKIRDVLRQEPSILKFDITADKEAGIYTARIETPQDVDLREKLSFALAAGKMAVLEMKMEEVSLEDVFLAKIDKGFVPSKEEPEKKEDTEA